MAKYNYNVRTGVTKIKTNTKKYFVAVVSTIVTVGAVSAPAFAAPGNSQPGIDRYLANPGRQQATEVGAQCDSGAGSGTFGYLGKDNNMAGGANGYQTGLNNSAVCGNRQSQ